jgi:CMP-N-acetylneuraminic acid synthetase
MKKVLSVICARAGSSGLKNKCIARIGAKMVVEYTIEYSLSLGDHVKTVVSTDIEPLIEYCVRRQIPYIRRDPAIAGDDSKIDDALADALEKEGQECAYCSLEYGNIPTRYPAIFQQAYRFLEEHEEYDAVMSMQNVEKFHPAWMFDLNDNVIPRMKAASHRRQELPQKMIADGHTLLFRSKQFYQKYQGTLAYEKAYKYAIFGEKIKPLLRNELIIDIDTAKDLQLAEAVLKRAEEAKP